MKALMLAYCEWNDKNLPNVESLLTSVTQTHQLSALNEGVCSLGVQVPVDCTEPWSRFKPPLLPACGIQLSTIERHYGRYVLTRHVQRDARAPFSFLTPLHFFAPSAVAAVKRNKGYLISAFGNCLEF